MIYHEWTKYPRGTPEKRPMRDSSKPANENRQDKIVITQGHTSRQRRTSPSWVMIGYSGSTWAEDMAPQGCDQSADPEAGMAGRYASRPKESSDSGEKAVNPRVWGQSPPTLNNDVLPILRLDEWFILTVYADSRGLRCGLCLQGMRQLVCR